MAGLSLGLFFGMIIIGLLSVVTLPRLLNEFIKENEIYPLYGFHFLLFQSITKMSNHYFYNLLFGDSSYIIYYLRAIGYKMSLNDQTGSNFGIEQKHDTPFLCDIGRGTLISDGLSMINADISNSSFRLRKISVPANSFLGNNVFYPADGKVGENCLLGTKVMVPISGPERSGVGLLGSPCFEIPRSVYPFTSPRQAGSGMVTWGMPLRARASRLVMYSHGSMPRRRQVSKTLKVAA